MLRSFFKPKSNPGPEETPSPAADEALFMPMALRRDQHASEGVSEVTNEWGAPLAGFDLDAEFRDLTVSNEDGSNAAQAASFLTVQDTCLVRIGDDGSISVAEPAAADSQVEANITSGEVQLSSPQKTEIETMTLDKPVSSIHNKIDMGRRILHMHIPKTAGTALRGALTSARGTECRIFPHYNETQIQSANASDWDLFSGHFGFKTASLLGGDIVTVLRHPVDRFISVYYFWQDLLRRGVEISRATQLTQIYSLDDFASLIDEIPLIEEFYNRMTWQVAHGSTIKHRKEMRDQGKTEDDVLKLAVANLESFAVVGLQNRLPEFSQSLERKFGFRLKIDLVNVTEKRPEVSDLLVRTRKRILNWLDLDMELYNAACELQSKGL